MTRNLGGIQALKDLQTLLSTASAEVSFVINEKKIGLVADNKEKILLQLDNENIDYFLHADDVFSKIAVTVHVVTYQGYDRFQTLANEVYGILQSNARFSINNHNYSDLLVKKATDLSKNYKGSFYMIYDLQLRIVNP